MDWTRSSAQAHTGFSRRRFLAGAASASVALTHGAALAVAPAERQLAGVMDRLWAEQQRRFPETIVAGDAGPIPQPAGRLAAWSREARADWIDWARSAVRRVEAIDATGLPQSAEIDRAVLLDHFGQIARLGTRYPFGAAASDPGAPVAPFAISPANGPHRALPALLGQPQVTSHPAARDADYENLAALPRAVDAATAAFAHDAASGIVPPAILLEATLGQITGLRGPTPGDAVLARLFARDIAPALERQRAALVAARPAAGAAAGAWTLRDGEAFYADALAWHTGSALTPGEAHELGLHSIAALAGELAAMQARPDPAGTAAGAATLDPAEAARAAVDLAPIRRQGMAYAGHAEGWALFAARLRDRQGAWAQDPASRAAMLRRELREAARLTADTGLHAMRWTPEQAADLLVRTTGATPEQAQAAVQRMIAAPGAACAAMVGLAEWQRLDALARRVGRSGCDELAFRSLLRHGPAPFAVLEQVVVTRFTPRRSERDMRSV